MFSRLATASLLAVSAFGCSATVSPSADNADAEAASSTAAVVVVERSDGARSEATARFLRMHAKPMTDDALRVVGATLDFPALGTCLSLSTLASTLASPPPAAGSSLAAPVSPVQLVHVGAVSMEANGVATNLLAREVPDVADLVSGVVYARATDAELLPAQSRYVLRVAGAADAEPFTVTASAPADLVDLRIDAQTPGARALAVGGGAIELAWEPGATDDAIYVDVIPSETTRLPTLRCSFADAGKATVAAALVPDEGTLSVHRLHRERFRARGIDSGEMRFDFAKVIAFTHR